MPIRYHFSSIIHALRVATTLMLVSASAVAAAGIPVTVTRTTQASREFWLLSPEIGELEFSRSGSPAPSPA